MYSSLQNKPFPHQAIYNLNQVCPLTHRRSLDELDELDELGMVTKQPKQAQDGTEIRIKRTYTRRLTRTGDNYSLAEHT